MAESNISKVVSAAQDNAVAKGKGQWFTLSDTMPPACGKCPKDVAAIIAGYIFEHSTSEALKDYRNADWKWEELADAVVSSTTYGIGPNHPMLKWCNANVGEALRSKYQRESKWIAAFGNRRPVISEQTYATIFDCIRMSVWMTFHHPANCAFSENPDSGNATSGKGKKVKPNVPRLA